MKEDLPTWLFCVLALGAAGCATMAPGEQVGAEPALELGLQWGTTAFVKNEVLDYPADYTHRMSSDRYEGVTLIQVTRSYDITDTSEAGHEQILRLSTSSDYEEFSTWDSLRQAQAAILGATDTKYSVSLRFAAELSSSVTTQNGILEIDPGSEDTLHVVWEYPAEDDELAADFPLEIVD